MRLKSIVVDDEKPSRELLTAMLEEYCPEIEVLGEADCAEDAVSLIARNNPEVIFLDVELQDVTGFDLLASLQPTPIKFQTVFVTAFNQYAIQAIKAGASDYLLKPLTKDELQTTVKKIFLNCPREKTLNLGLDAAELNRKLTLPHLKGFKIIDLKDIVRIEAASNYSQIFFLNNTKVVISKPLKDFEKKLNSRWFFRTHKSHVINLYHLKEYLTEDGGYALMSDGHKVDISRFKTAEFLNYIGILTQGS